MYLECAHDLPCPPNLDDTGSLCSPPHQVVYSLIQPWVTVSHFLVGNMEAELKHTTFSSLLLFHVFLSFLFSGPPIDIVALSAACWG